MIPMRAALLGLGLSGFLAFACTRPPPPEAPRGTTTVTSTEVAATPVECTLSCETATLTTPGALQPDHHAAATRNIDEVFASMHDDLLACYRARVRTNPRAHAFLVLTLVLEPDGRVRRVTTTGGAHLGDGGLRCITRRVEQATFAPVHDGGTLSAEIPLVFRRLGPDDTD